MARRDDVTLTEELLRDGPLKLLNADEEQIERLLREGLERLHQVEEVEPFDTEQQVALGLATARALRRVFETINATRFVWDEFKSAVDEAGRLYDETGPRAFRSPALCYVWSKSLPGDQVIALRWGDDPLPEDADVVWEWTTREERRAAPAWEALAGGFVWAMLFKLLPVRRGDYVICEECGAIFERGERGPAPRWCSSACRARAWRERK